MARMPGTTWRPLSINHSKGGNRPRVVILHIIVGTLSGADSWFRNRSSRVSAHFGVGKDGRIYQWVDTADRAWANAGANPYSISIENEGNVGDALTPAQVEACARILAWASKAHGITLRVNDSVNGSGLSYHRMSPSWSLGGTACPGDRIIAQRSAIVARAKQLAAGADPATPTTSGDEEMLGLKEGDKGEAVKALQTSLRHAGFGEYLGTYGPNKDGVDGIYGKGVSKAVLACRKWVGSSATSGTSVTGSAAAQIRRAVARREALDALADLPSGGGGGVPKDLKVDSLTAKKLTVG